MPLKHDTRAVYLTKQEEEPMYFMGEWAACSYLARLSGRPFVRKRDLHRAIEKGKVFHGFIVTKAS